MTAEQLRNSILQEAISGRLVPQDPNDEPAAIVSTVPEDEIPFEIPASWRWIRMKDCATIIGGYAFPSASIKGEKGVRVIRISDINEKGFVNKSVVRYNGHENLNKFKIIPQDILIAMTGGTVGKSLFVQQMDEDMLLNQRVAIIRNNGQYAPYIDIVVKSPHIKSFINDKKNSTNDNISMGDINSFLVPLPPLAEQKRIVAKLEELLPIVEQYGKAQKELDELNAALPARLRQSILQEAISGKLVPQDERDEPAYLFLERLQNIKEGLVKQKILKKDALSFGVVKEEDIPFEIPANWEWRYLGDLVYLISGTSYKKDDVCNNGIRILRGGNIVNDKLILADDDVFLSEEYRSEEKNIKPNDIVIVASTGSKKVIGKPALVQEPIADTQIGAFLRIVRPIDAAYVPYLWTLFRSEYYRGHIRDLVKGTNINNIKEEYLTYMPIPLPPLAEQKRIVAKIEELFEQINRLNETK